jgi:hypothetical protein
MLLILSGIGFKVITVIMSVKIQLNKWHDAVMEDHIDVKGTCTPSFSHVTYEAYFKFKVIMSIEQTNNCRA